MADNAEYEPPTFLAELLDETGQALQKGLGTPGVVEAPDLGQDEAAVVACLFIGCFGQPGDIRRIEPVCDGDELRPARRQPTRQNLRLSLCDTDDHIRRPQNLLLEAPISPCPRR